MPRLQVLCLVCFLVDQAVVVTLHFVRVRGEEESEGASWPSSAALLKQTASCDCVILDSFYPGCLYFIL